MEQELVGKKEDIVLSEDKLNTLESLKDDLISLYEGEKYENNLKQKDFFIKLYNYYIPKNRFFLLRKNHPSKKDQNYDKKARTIFIGDNATHFISGVYEDFEHKSKFPANILQLGYSIDKNNYYLFIAIGIVKDDLTKKVLNEFASNENFVNSGKDYLNKEFKSFEELIKTSNKFDEHLKSNNAYKPISYNEFKRMLENRVKNIKSEKIKNNPNKDHPFFSSELFLNYKENTRPKVRKALLQDIPENTSVKDVFSLNLEQLDNLIQAFEKGGEHYEWDYNTNHSWGRASLKKYNEYLTSNKTNNLNSTQNIKKMESNNLLSKKNQIILYGPPGTGKTYNTDKIIQNFLDGNKDLLTKNESINLNGVNLKFITFHQSFAYEEFIEGLKPISGEKKSELERDYKVESGCFKEFCEKAINDVLIDSEVGLKSVDNFEAAIDKLKEEISEKEEIELKTETNAKFKVSYRNGRTFRIKPESSNSENDYPANIENIKALYFKTKELSEIYNPSYVKGILNYMIKHNYIEENKKELRNIYEDLTKEQRRELFEGAQPYFLVIDEINRGNISKIFGELITLLEKDKRLGNEDELIVELPYSKEKFGIPPNVYLIGTMNTSDKSIASLDIALRRRFGFIEILPNSDLISNDIEGFNLRSLFENLNGRIEFLLDKDHLIGHSFFRKVTSKEEIKDIFVSEILPLLEEYFYGDIEKLRLVLGDDFFEKRKTDDIRKLFANNSNLDLEDDLFKLKDFKTNNENIILYLEKIINLETQENKDEE